MAATSAASVACVRASSIRSDRSPRARPASTAALQALYSLGSARAFVRAALSGRGGDWRRRSSATADETPPGISSVPASRASSSKPARKASLNARHTDAAWQISIATMPTPRTPPGSSVRASSVATRRSSSGGS